jgi:hypothetical protein
MFHVKHMEDVETGNVSRETFPGPYFLRGWAQDDHSGKENRGAKMGPFAQLGGPPRGVKSGWLRHDQASSVF